jgi:hypothetical protein
MKIYKMRSRAFDNGKNSVVDLQLQFEGKRAFAIWDTISFGKYELTARLEINPKLLQKAGNCGYDFFYRGELVLPRPENN